ncbi:MAG: Non-ous end joining protein Ku [Rhodospirillales bacterium]|nr:Non-ous end joining protein Ku [Rhodospirillales bacterium]
MGARPYWKGYLRLSLVSCRIKLFPAASEWEKVRLHLINKKTGHRIKYCKLDAETGEQVDDEDIVMGYEVDEGRYIEITKDEREAVAIESKHTIEIDQFVPRNEIDALYLSNPYYITPDGEVARQAYAVIRAAIEKEHMAALGRVVFTTREHVIAIEPRGKGLLGVTLRYPYEIRNAENYFNDLPDEKIDKEMLDLATHIVVTKAGHFVPEKFEDRYERAIKELIEKKQRGETIEKPKERAPAKVINLMEALRRSVIAEREPKRREPAGQRATARSRHGSARRLTRARKAG